MRLTQGILLLICLFWWTASETDILNETEFNSEVITLNNSKDSMPTQNRNEIEDSLHELDDNNSFGRYWRRCSDQMPCPYPDVFRCRDDKCIRLGIDFHRTNENIGYLLIFIVILLSNIWGLGGGYLTVIILYMIFGFESRKTFGYAAFFNFLSWLVKYVYSFTCTHPTKPFHTLIDYEMVMIFLPLGITGMLVGNIAFAVVPMISIAVLLALFWGIFALDLFIRGIRMFMQEFRGEEVHKKLSSVYQRNYVPFEDCSEFVEEKKDKRKTLQEHPVYDPRTVSLNSDIHGDFHLQTQKGKFSATDSVESKELNQLLDSGNRKTQANDNEKNSKPSPFTDRTELVAFALSQMRYLDSDDESDSEEHKILMDKVQDVLLVLNPGTPEEVRKEKEGEFIKMQGMIEAKLKRQGEKMQLLKLKIKKSEGRHFGIKTLFILANVLLLIGNYILRGSTRESLVGINQCDFGDWAIFITIGTLAFILALMTLGYLRNIYLQKRKSGYVIQPSDAHWNISETVRLLTISWLLGFLSGILGLGEGTEYIPLLISLGKHPYVASATGMKISLILSLWVTFIYVIEGFFDDLYPILIGGITLVAALIGIIINDILFRKIKKPSIMIILISVNLLAIALTLPNQILHRKFQTNDGPRRSTDFGIYCQYDREN